MSRKFMIGLIVLTVVSAGLVTVQAIAGRHEPEISLPTAPAAQKQSDPFLLENEADPAQPDEKRAAEKPQEPSKVVETYQQPSQPAAAPQPAQSEPEPQKNEAGGHIPFTNLPVIPGDPASYINTVGQCPFYEMGGDKGCIPPPDIECNADWSICTLKADQ